MISNSNRCTKEQQLQRQTIPYFSQEIITAENLIDNQNSICDLLLRHNSLLHYFGVVCGLEILPVINNQISTVIVTPGYAISPNGDEIQVSSPQLISIHGLEDRQGNRLDLPSPSESQKVYLAIQYAEQPVPTQWERNAPLEVYSRIQTGARIACLNYLPQPVPPAPFDLTTALRRLWHPTPPKDLTEVAPLFVDSLDLAAPWVVLAALEIAPDGKITIDYSVRTLMPSMSVALELWRGLPTLAPPPQITGISPYRGPGKPITLRGSNFLGATEVLFNIQEVDLRGINKVQSKDIEIDPNKSIVKVKIEGCKEDDSGQLIEGLKVMLDNQIDVVIPDLKDLPKLALTGIFTVTTPAGTGTSSQTSTVIPPPTIKSFTPQRGTVGTAVFITGTYLSDTTAVTFNGQAAQILKIESDTKMTVLVPAGATTGKIQVSTLNGDASSLGCDFVVSRPIEAITPSQGQRNTTIRATITGVNLSSAGSISFKGADTTVTGEILAGGTAEQLPVLIQISSDATPGAYPFQIRSWQNLLLADSDSVTFTVQ